MAITRREFGRVTLASTPVVGALLRGTVTGAITQTPPVMSRWSGVQVGLNVPYSLGTGNNIAAEDLLERIVAVGVGSVELRAQPVEHFLGSPTVRAAAEAATAREAARAAGQIVPTPQQMAQGGRRAGQTQTPEQIEAARRQQAEVRAWRLSAPSSRLKQLRQMYEKAGVLIDVLKVDDLYTISNEELDYFFQMARDLGARAVSSELPGTRSDTRRIGAFADKHKVFVAYHHHAQATAALYEQIFDEARYNGANIDIGHWTATLNESPLPFIARHADRIPHIHVKDRRFGTNGGENRPFGQGDTPLRQILQAIRDNKWDIRPIIEFEYRIPDGSTRVAEIAKCLQYCRESLLA
ncbi:MAG: sugar phosphate isomerase/epimerase [Acidobacteria bacterium]|nr:sugar phosphate isomerase/epimerase [Acidobacteriota bacterium]